MTTLTKPRRPAASTPAPSNTLAGFPRIGQTPLVRLRHVTAGLQDTVAVYAKAEFMNPGGSVKDRPAQGMIREGLRSGVLTPEKTLLDATSGNTGIAYAMLGAALGLRVQLALPANASTARKQILKAYGAELLLTDPLEGMDGAQHVVRGLAARYPERYFYPDQYNNDANWQAHFNGTGPEIWEQTEGRISHFVAALGTTGTFTGVSRYLARQRQDVRCISVQPETALHGIEGMKHMETALVPGIYDPELATANLSIATDEAFAMTRRLAREEGLLVGPSSGANVAAALRVAEGLEAGIVITILCDTGMRYLGDTFWNEP